MSYTIEQLDYAVRTAIMVERERCAKLCEAIESDMWRAYKGLPPYDPFVRSHPSAKNMIRALRAKPDFSENVGRFTHLSSGPSPMERQDGWQDVCSFLYTWTSVVNAGLLQTTWFDVHAAL